MSRRATRSPQATQSKAGRFRAAWFSSGGSSAASVSSDSEAWQPYSEGQMSAGDAVQTALVPLRGFMLAQTRESSLQSLAEIAGDGPYAGPEAVPLTVLVPAFVLSELTTAFQIGFMLFIPFVVIDLVVASVLMSMGMMMLSPMLVSLPMKIMLFVLVDGWALLVGSLAESFR